VLPLGTPGGIYLMRVYLGPRAFAKLERWCAVPNTGKHKTGGMQDRRARWKAQLDQRRGHLTARERAGPTSDAERWIEITVADAASIRNCIRDPKGGGYQRDMRDIFGGVVLE
jgi:hypothetical protein